MRAFLKNHKVVKVLLWIVIIVLTVVVFALIFMRAYPVFGGRPTSADRKDYAKTLRDYVAEQFRGLSRALVERL